ncbi:unnamed protein product, partial [marine sediment metagenome]
MQLYSSSIRDRQKRQLGAFAYELHIQESPHMKDQKLQDLMKLANEGHEGVLDAHNRCIDAAIKCGDALNAAKE